MRNNPTNIADVNNEIFVYSLAAYSPMPASGSAGADRSGGGWDAAGLINLIYDISKLWALTFGSFLPARAN